MKKYIRSRIFMTIKTFIAIIMILFIGKETYENKSSTVRMNTILNNSKEKKIIPNTQNELYKEVLYNPLYTFTGELTGYAGDCPLCSGYLACPPRTNVLKEGIYYNDKTYGTVRIVASSKNYPCGTILKFNVNKLSDEPIVAIVLDRGVSGNVIDLLTTSEDHAIKSIGRVKNLEFEVLRKGWKK